LAAILKMADISKFWKRRIAPLMVTYHYVKLYVSIIIHLEVININVRNFNFPIGFYSNPPAQIQHCPISTPFDMWLWCPEFILNIEKFLPVAIFKMAATIPHKFNIVRFQRPELIPDIEKFLPVSIFKLIETIPQKFNIVRFQR
jgi:hypothetical protein